MKLIIAAVCAAALATPAFANTQPPSQKSNSPSGLRPGPCTGSAEVAFCMSTRDSPQAIPSNLSYSVNKCGAQWEAIAWRPNRVIERKWRVKASANSAAIGAGNGYSGTGFNLSISFANRFPNGQYSGRLSVKLPGHPPSETVMCRASPIPPAPR